jgi:hypothetical protein
MIEINLQKIIGTHEGQVTVKRGGKMFTQTRRLGKKVSGREGTGKLDKLPSDVKDSIIELRNLNYSGTEIKNNIETMLETADPEVRQKLIDANVITDTGSKLTVTPVAITQFAAKHGATPTKTRGPKTAESVQAQEKAKHETTKGQLSEADKKIATLETELQAVKDRIEANRVDAANKQKVREKLRSDLRACHEELGS